MSLTNIKTLKAFVLVIIISVCGACRSSVKPEDTTTILQKVGSNLPLPPPIPKHITIYEGGVVVVAWDPVEAKEDNPILGLKIKLWDQEKHKVYKYDTVNGTSQLIEEWVPVEKSVFEMPRHKPAFEAVLPPDALETRFVVKKGEEYEIRGQSYNAEGDGPLSTPTGFKIHNEIVM